MEFHLENRGLLDRWPKNSRCKRHRAEKGTRAVFPYVSTSSPSNPCYAPRAIPPHSSCTISPSLPLLPMIWRSDSTFPPLNLGTPQISRLRFRTPFVARRHARWRVPAMTSRTCAELLWRKEPAKYNDSFFRVHRSRWDICRLGSWDLLEFT